MSYLVWGLIMANYSMFASLDKETPPKENFLKKEEALSHRIATSIFYDLNLRLEVK